jgi:glycosyltransferase involved in cell wall biosynthesis
LSNTVSVGAERPAISIVVRAYNEERFIRTLFVGLGLQSRQDFEVILVDSGSTDRTPAIAEEFGARIVRIPKSEFSFGRSLNIGCSAARGDLLVFVSAHVYPARTDWLAQMAAPFEDQAVGLVYGKQRGNEITKFSEHQVFLKWFPDRSVANQASYFCNNANCAIRRSLWEALPYDESLTGLEDIAWAKEAKRRGARICYVGDAEIIHVHDETWGRVRNRYQREAIALRAIEPALRFSFLDFARLSWANILADLREARRQKLLGREWRDIILFRLCQFWGTYQGHRFHSAVTAEIRERFYFPPSVENDPAEASSGPASSPASGQAISRIDYDRVRSA